MSPAGVAHGSAHGGKRHLVFVHHADDAGICAALEHWERLNDAVQLANVISVACRSPRGDAEGDEHHDMPAAAPFPQSLRHARFLDAGTWTDVALMYTLHGADEISRIDILSACTPALASSRQRELAEADRQLRLDLQRIAAPHTSVALHRVWLPGFSEAYEGLAPCAEYAQGEADHLFVVMPENRQHERAVALLMRAHDSGDAYSWHVAVELASLGGLWSTMRGAPVELTARVHSGMTAPVVRLVRSTCRAARIHTPSPEHTFEGGAMLPLTSGYLPAADQMRVVADAAQRMFPAEFRCLREPAPAGPDAAEADGSSDDADDLHGASEGGRAGDLYRLLMPLSKPVGRRRHEDLPLRRVMPHSQSASGRIGDVQRFVDDTAAAAPWTASLMAGDGSDADWSDAAIRTARRQLDRERVPVSLESVPSTAWDIIITNAFGLADGAEPSAPLRAATMGGRFLITDPAAMAPAPGDLSQTVARLDAAAARRAPTLGRRNAEAGPDAHRDRAGGGDAADRSASPAPEARDADDAVSGTDPAVGGRDAGTAREVGASRSGRRGAVRQSADRFSEGSVGMTDSTGRRDEHALFRFWFPRRLIRRRRPADQSDGGIESDAAGSAEAESSASAEADFVAGVELDAVSGSEADSAGDRLHGAMGDSHRDAVQRDDPCEQMPAPNSGEPIPPCEPPPLQPPDMHRPTLLGSVTREFDQEIRLAGHVVDAELAELRERLSYEQRPEPGVTSFVAHALLVSGLILLGALLTLTPLREAATVDRLTSDQRIMAFGVLCLLVVTPPILRLMPRSSRAAQVHLILTAAGLSAAVSTVVVLAPQIATSPLDRPGQWGPAIIICAAVMTLALTARARGFRGDRELLGPFAPLVSDFVATAVPIVFAFVLIVAAANRNATASADAQPPAWRLLAVVLSSTVAMALVAAGLIWIIRRRDRRVMREWMDRVDEAIDGCEVASARADMVVLLKSHWLATAAVLARLTHRPFGRGTLAGASRDPVCSVRKLRMFDLELSRETRDAFLGEIIPELAGRGWLGDQYRLMSARFAASERRRLGILSDEAFPPPEHCTYPEPPADKDVPVRHGFRWRFAEQVFSGGFDGLLRERTDEAMRRAMQATFMNEDVSVAAGSEGLDAQPLPVLLGELLPTDAKNFPAGMLPPSTEAAPVYEAYVWWPTDMAVPDGKPTPTLTCSYVPDGSTVLFHAVRVDISEPVNMERLLPLRPPGAAAPPDAAAPDAVSPLM
ncbi:hypothetical protein [Candidatus Poriferisodalis sp.]|uniref:hypothetical protein n=1 Tax=Candidatus Poriferisodalis sp. TaxID=3101277 RepID=UPI003B01820B